MVAERGAILDRDGEKLGEHEGAIGYTVGTGSITSMTRAGSQFGMQLLWLLALSCLFSWFMMEAAGR